MSNNDDVNFGNVRRLQELVDKNSKNIPEGDYLALCDITKKLYEREEEMTIITWMVCLRQAEQAMQCCASRPGFDPANNPKHEARLRKYEMRRRKYVRRLETRYDVPVYVEYDMEAKQLQVAYPDYSETSDDSDDSDNDDDDDDEEVPTNDPVADDDSDDDEEVPTDDPVAGDEFQDGSPEHPVDLTGEDEDVTKSGFVLKFLGTEIFRVQ
jgi:hypothetical protein